MMIRPDLPFVDAAGDTRFVLVTFEAPRGQAAATRPPLDVAFAIDCSGSMSGPKIVLATEAVSVALRLLQPTDTFAIVGYDNEIYDVWPLSAATPEHVRSADRRLRALEGGGTTALEEGWRRAAGQVAGTRAGAHHRRTLLLTDGLANVGITDPTALIALGREWREKGVVTTAFGVGSDFDERLLQGIADAGQGHFYFVERAEQIPDLLTSELGETLETVARDVWVDVALPAGASLAVLGKASVSAAPAGGISVSLGDLTSAEVVSILLAVTLPATDPGSVHTVRWSLRDREGALSVAPAATSWAVHAAGEQPDATPDAEVLRERARARLWMTREQALEANRSGDYSRARSILMQFRAEFSGVADADVEGLMQASLDDDAVFAVPMRAMEQKRQHFAASSAQRRRAADGKARKA